MLLACMLIRISTDLNRIEGVHSLDLLPLVSLFDAFGAYSDRAVDHHS